MGGQQSFDISTGCDLQEVDNAVNQCLKELRQRFDFRGVKFEIIFAREQSSIEVSAPDDAKLTAIWDVLQTKMVKRQVPVKNLKPSDPQPAAGGTVKQTIALQQGIPGETAKKIVKFIKDKKLKKVQAAIQKDEVRVSSPSRDALQEVMTLLKQEDWDLDLNFGNYRG